MFKVPRQTDTHHDTPLGNSLLCLLYRAYSKPPIPGLTQFLIGLESCPSPGQNVEYHDRLHIYPVCGIFYFHWHRPRHQIEGTNGFKYPVRKTHAIWGKLTCPMFRSGTQTTELPPLPEKPYTVSNVESSGCPSHDKTTATFLVNSYNVVFGKIHNADSSCATTSNFLHYISVTAVKS